MCIRDRALIVGGDYSSNTSHLVEICSDVMPSYLIANADEIVSAEQIRHFDIHARSMVQARDWLPGAVPVRLIITSGASCPDILMNQVLEKIAGFYDYGAADIAAAQLSLFEELS